MEENEIKNPEVSETVKETEQVIEAGVEVEVAKKEAVQTERKNDYNKKPRRDFRRPEKKPSEFIDQVVSIKRVTKVTKGGRQLRFAATVVVGNKKGKVGLGTGKATEIAEACAKAVKEAQKNLVLVPIINNSTIPHEAIGVSGAGKVMLKPALKGTGVKAGGPVRAVLELAGITDILSKSLGSNTKINMVHATFNALKQMKTIEQIASKRGKSVEEILG